MRIRSTRTLYMCWSQGLPRPEPQHKVYDKNGRLFARLDFAWPAHKVWLEFDGRIKYQQLLKEGDDVTTVVLREKKREETIARLTGWQCIRITWADLYKPRHGRGRPSIAVPGHNGRRLTCGRDQFSADPVTSQPRSRLRSDGLA